MAIYREKVGLLKEGLIEMLHVAEYTVTYRKTDRAKWADNATGGILGYPAVVVLFSIIDCLGSIFTGDNTFTIPIDKKNKCIRSANQHIYIFNSKYFNLNLSEIDLNNIYNNVRSTLTHNLLLPEGYILQTGENENLPLNIAINEFDKSIYFINVIKLYEFTKRAIEEFIIDLDNGKIAFEASVVHSNVSKRDVSTLMYQSSTGQYQIPIKKWIKK